MIATEKINEIDKNIEQNVKEEMCPFCEIFYFDIKNRNYITSYGICNNCIKDIS